MNLVCITALCLTLLTGLFQPESKGQIPSPSRNAAITASPFALPGDRISPAEVQFISNLAPSLEKSLDVFWDFGDGTFSEEFNPSHRYISGGEYHIAFQTRLENELVLESNFPLVIDQVANPRIIIDPYPSRTQAESLTLSGKIRVHDQVGIASFVWDQVSTDRAGFVENLSSDNTWELSIPLKPGTNEILFTATDEHANIGTKRIQIERVIKQPEIHDVVFSSTEIPVHTKLELTFDVLTSADNLFYEYDEDPPVGVVPRSGITVTAHILTPSGITVNQPAHYSKTAINLGSQNEPRMIEGDTGVWYVRFSPPETGEYQITLAAKDRSGEVEVDAGKFTAVSSNLPGNIEVCEKDYRYFCFANGELFFPSGPVTSEDLSAYPGSGINFARVWMAPIGAYSTTFSRWISNAKQMGNEGFEAALTAESHYPAHELSQKLDAEEGNRIWLGWIEGDRFPYQLDTGATYLVKLRISARNMQGPLDSNRPYGLMLINHPWIDDDSKILWEDYPSLVPVIQTDRDWHTLLAYYRPGQLQSPAPYFSLVLSNMASGEVFIDEFSIRKVTSDGNPSGEVIFNSNANIHTYVESKAAAYLDQLIANGEEAGVFFKFVVHDKNDWIQNHLKANGQFSTEGDGYFQPENTKANWLLRQWWRYVASRWGYSTSIHSWELLNEGPPDSQEHYNLAQQFGKFMHSVDAHPHLVTTSFWYGWEESFWKDAESYPDIDYADYHLYVTEKSDFSNIVEWKNRLGATIYSSAVEMPVMLGELGFFLPDQPEFRRLVLQDTQGLWFRDLIWSQLADTVIFTPAYWWNEHLNQIDYLPIAQAFNNFVKDIPFQQGGFSAAEVEIESSQWTAVGQISTNFNYAAIWLHRLKPPSWLSRLSRPVKVYIQVAPSQKYQVRWYDTLSSRLLYTEYMESNSSGILELHIWDPDADVAVKIRKQ
ncbi:hypothetical protein ADN00_00425 [Ornatilinea apprima]|uniref:PKD domain-containing protein n=1 Tax=Ornatilinea apprima TaxID=1134406 RepID=A0A0P6XL88_9CHLR|nr:PKD domain-containing protein [Ornatilinea apprima]KPL81040.1 hypothetical protein ADN00_00425 [Ornatilinea apprima]